MDQRKNNELASQLMEIDPLADTQALPPVKPEVIVVTPNRPVSAVTPRPSTQLHPLEASKIANGRKPPPLCTMRGSELPKLKPLSERQLMIPAAVVRVETVKIKRLRMLYRWLTICGALALLLLVLLLLIC